MVIIFLGVRVRGYSQRLGLGLGFGLGFRVRG